MNLYSSRTAIHRTKPSAPLLALLERKLILGNVLDYGGGRGQDYLYLCSMDKYYEDFDVNYWDPNFEFLGMKLIEKENPYILRTKFDTVLCTYVLNVLLPEKRKKVIEHIQSILSLDGSAFITVRADKVSGTEYEDGESLRRKILFRKDIR